MTYKGIEIDGTPTLDMVREFMTLYKIEYTPEEVHYYCKKRMNVHRLRRRFKRVLLL